MKPKYAILGAFNQEIDEYKNHLSEHQEVIWHDYTLWLGGLFGSEVIMTKTGVGKVHAALVTQHLIDTYEPEAFIFTGLAGGLSLSLEIGDVVVSKDLIQHDFVAHPQFPKYTIPSFDRQKTYSVFEATPDLRAKALAYTPSHHKVVEGRILTGDQFLTRDDLAAYHYLTDTLQGTAVEMEGAGVAQVCTINKKPFVVVRTISDRADLHAPIDFDAFLSHAATNSLGVIKKILEK
jgi:5'-methylthioadenosine/S-adenosylhomocysteine nucleosidase